MGITYIKYIRLESFLVFASYRILTTLSKFISVSISSLFYLYFIFYVCGGCVCCVYHLVLVLLCIRLARCERGQGEVANQVNKSKVRKIFLQILFLLCGCFAQHFLSGTLSTHLFKRIFFVDNKNNNKMKYVYINI